MIYDLKIDFISQYAGAHRICWRIGTGAYDCTTTVNCTGGGAACAAIISVNVNDDSCTNIDFNGYVQAQCNPVESLEGRVPFNITFTPNPECLFNNLICASGGILSFTLDNPGSGYTQGSIINITIVPTGDGDSGEAIGHVGDNSVNALTLSVSGSGYPTDGLYLNVPTVPGGTNPTVAGTGYVFDYVEITGGVITGYGHTTMFSPGTGYIVGETFTIDTTAVGIPVSEGYFTVVSLYPNDQIVWTELVNEGKGYNATVNASFESGNATISEVVLIPCPSFTLVGTDCGANVDPVIPTLEVGESINFCATTGAFAEPPGNWELNSTADCCYDCSNMIIEKIGEAPVTLTYIDCTTRCSMTHVLTDTSFTVCAVTNSVTIIDGNGFIINDGACPVV